MKQLKFMLAAATAIGLATAAQAGYLSGSTDFESDTDTVRKLFTSTDEAALDDSTIEDGAAVGVAVGNNPFTGDKKKKLKVSAGTTPILRSVNGSAAGASLADGEIYIDTLVQFTATVDEVEKTDGDKLMVYMKEISTETENGDTVKSYKFYAKGGFMENGELKYTDYPLDIIGDDVNVLPNVWYRLTVKAHANVAFVGDGIDVYPAFEIFINGQQALIENGGVCVDMSNDNNSLLFLESGFEDSFNKVILSMAKGDSTLKAVGFAGEGEVDDLVISTFDPSKTVIDFILAYDITEAKNNGLTAISYSSSVMGNNVAISAGDNTAYCEAGKTITVNYSLVEGNAASWNEGGDATPTGEDTFIPVDGGKYILTVVANAPSTVDFTLTLGKGVSAVQWTIAGTDQTGLSGKVQKDQVIKIVKVTYEDWYGPTGDYVDNYQFAYSEAFGAGITVEAKELTTAGDVGVTVPEGTPAETTSAAIAWAKAAGKTTDAVKGAANIVANYLLNVADLSKEPQIKIVEIDVSGEVPVVKAAVTEADGTTTIKELNSNAINGTIKYKTAAELKDLKTATPKPAIGDGDKFIQVVVE